MPYLKVIREFARAVIVLVALLILPASVIGQMNEPATGRRAAELVSQLGDEEFANRERASTKLIELGIKAAAALEQGQRSPNREIRYRSRKILSLINEIDFQQRLDEFRRDTDPQRDYGLPGWERFCEISGSTSAARSLFVAMYEGDRELMVATDDDDSGLGAITRRCKALRRRAPFGGRETPLGTVAAMLLIATDERIELTPLIRNTVYYACEASSFQAAIESGPKRPPLVKLTSEWIQRDNLQPVVLALHLGMTTNIDTCLPKARAALKQPQMPSDPVYGCLCVAKFGDESDFGLLEKYLEDVNICGQAQVEGQIIVTQIRDLALASLVRLSGQDTAKFGFDRLQRRRQLVFELSSLGFRDEDRRQQAIAAWREYRRQKSQDQNQ